jgi:hypothetical protein
VRNLDAFHSVVKVSELEPEAVAEVLELLLERMGLEVLREKTPDYTAYSLLPEDSK